MDKYKIAQIIENFAPLTLAEEWDASGWGVETDKTEVNKVMLCLTVTDDIVKQAKAKNGDMIVSHHPLFYIDCHSELVSESLKPKIDIYCTHTNMDKTKGGTTDTLIEALGLVADEPKHPFVRIVETDIALDDFVRDLRKISPNLRYVNNCDAKKLKRIAFCAGSGSEFIKEVDCDAYVTGDLKFHTAIESDKVIFDIGHFESEILVLSVFEKLLADKVETVRAEEKSPFIY